MKDLGPIDYAGFLSILRKIDWRHEANQAEWAMKSSPTLAVTNRTDGCTFWVSGVIAGSIINVDADPDERFRTDRNEPWYIVGMNNPPEISNIVAFDTHTDGNNLGFTAFTTEPVEECFEWFFEEDYLSLYGSFRWV